MNRGHHYDAFLDAMTRSRDRGFEICAHVILGLPGESRDDMLATARELARLGLDSVKLHNLYAVQNTPLAERWPAGEVRADGTRRIRQRRWSISWSCCRPGCVVERLSGDAPPDYLVGPAWCLDKPAVRLALEAELVRRDTWQGKRWQPIAD